MRWRTGALVVVPLGILASLTPAVAHADSPLTSTDLHSAYDDVPMVQTAVKASTQDDDRPVDDMTEELATYLDDATNPLDQRIAVINALGWSFGGKHDAEAFSAFIFGVPLNKLDLTKLRPDELLCVGYLQVMDDYFHPKHGLAALAAAQAAMPHSLLAALILGLARAENDMDDSFCKAGKDVSPLWSDHTMTKDLRDGAITSIKGYMDEYTCP
jgi:hypothetical protein